MIEVQLTYSAIFVSGLQHSDSTILYITQCHHNVYSHPLLPYSIGTVLTMFPMLCISLLWFISFITASLYLLLPFTYFTHPPPTSLLATTSLDWRAWGFLLLLLFFCSVFNSTCKWNQAFVFAWPISLSIIFSSFIFTILFIYFGHLISAM